MTKNLLVRIQGLRKNKPNIIGCYEERLFFDIDEDVGEDAGNNIFL